MNTPRPKSVKNNQSVGKAFQIIEVMAFERAPMRLQDIGRAIGLHPSTVLRFLKTLMEQDYVGQNQQNSQYYLTMKLCRLGEEIKHHFRFRDIVRPYLESMAKEWKESAFLAVEQDLNVVYIDAVDGPDHMLRTLQRIGKMAPLNSTGVGKCLLTGFDEAEVDRLIKEKGLPSPTSKTIADRETLLAEIERIRKNGYAIDDEECELGVRCVAAPISDYSGKVVAAISTSGPMHRMDREKMQAIKSAITDIARRISKDLGHVGLPVKEA